MTNPTSAPVLDNTSDIVVLAVLGTAGVALIVLAVFLVMRYGCNKNGGGGGGKDGNGGGGNSSQVYAAPSPSKPQVKKNAFAEP